MPKQLSLFAEELTIKDSIIINELIKPIIENDEIIKCLIYKNATDVQKELIQEWLKK